MRALPSNAPGASAGTRATSSAEEEVRHATQTLETLRDRLRAAGTGLVAVEGESGEDDETTVPISAVIFCVVLDHLDPAIADLRRAASGENKEAEGMAATLGRLLVDPLQPALALLKREAAGQPVEESAAEENATREEAAARC
jgi:hypothetical protein